MIIIENSAGVKSMVYGENEILSQIKSFYSYCQKQGGFQSHMNKLFQSAIHVGKQVREETLISKGAYSISSIAVDVMLDVFDDFCTDRKVLIVGAGIMSRRAIKKLKAIGHQEVYVTNRSQRTLDALSDEFGLAQIDYLDYKAQLSDFDCVYFATSAKDHVLSYDDLSPQESSLLLVDVGVPRNVDPNLNNQALVSLITIDDLKKTADKTFLQRKKDSARVFEIINSSATEFTRWYEHRKAIIEEEICLNASA